MTGRERIPVLRGQLNIYTMETGDGRDLELSVVNDCICWRRVGDIEWIKLVPLDDITPMKGVDYWTEEDQKAVVEYVSKVIGYDIPHENLLGRDKPDQHSIDAISGLREELDNRVRVTGDIIPGSLMIASADPGCSTCTDITYSELISKIDSKAEVVGRIIPGTLVVADKDGNLVSSELQPLDIKNALDRKVELTSQVLPGALLVATKDGNASCCGTTFEDLVEIIESKTEIIGDIIPGSLALLDASGKICSLGVTYEELLDHIDSKLTLEGETHPGTLVVANEEGKLVSSVGPTYGQLLDRIDSKTEVVGDILPGTLLLATEDGNVSCSGLLVSDLVTREELLAGAISLSTTVNKAGEKTITMPAGLEDYSTVLVYLNGILMVEGIHYSVSRDHLNLLEHSTYAGDVFTFVGYGTTISSNGSTGHTHSNKSVLDSIDEERVNKWDSQENIIESIWLSDESVLPIEDKTVRLPIGSLSSLGVVKSSNEENKIFIDVDGTMSVNSIDATKLIVPEDQELILVAGDSTSRLS